MLELEKIKNTVINGDSIEIMSNLPDKCIDMIFCDLPYGTTQNSWDVVIPFEKLWPQYERIIKNNGVIALMAQAPFDKVLACSNLKLFKYEWIWHKNKATGHLNAKRAPMKAHENILIFYKNAPTYNPQMTSGHKPMNAVKPRLLSEKEKEKRNYNPLDKRTGNPGGSTVRYPRDVVEFPVMNNDNKNKFHPTQKPVELIEYFIKTYSNEGELILDNCSGSGSTLVAALNCGRNFIGIEKEQEYYRKSTEWLDSIMNNGNKLCQNV
jgi:DNA modification methylase